MGKHWHTAHRWDLEWQDDVDILTLGSCTVFASFRGPSSQHRYPGSVAGDM